MSSQPTSSPASAATSPSDLYTHDAPSTTPPPPFPGETFLSTWTNLKFFLGAPDPSSSSWATLAAFYGTGTAHLSTCRLVFILDPPPPAPSPSPSPSPITSPSPSPSPAPPSPTHSPLSSPRSFSTTSTSPSSSSSFFLDSSPLLPSEPLSSAIPPMLSIPLVWLQRDRLRLCRPFFDSDHLAGVLVPADLTATAPLPPSRVFSAPGKPMRFRIEALDPDQNHKLCSELRRLLADPDRVARDTRALRHAADTRLVPTDSHYAFVDPQNPSVLHLATLMTQPEEFDLTPP